MFSEEQSPGLPGLFINLRSGELANWRVKKIKQNCNMAKKQNSKPAKWCHKN
jgi:hypothetical protein